MENAHEAAAVQGSFFTHHVAAGLLGAADKSGDGNVTLQEVFDHAKERTVRDSARMAVTTQHPSFDLQTLGYRPLPLLQVHLSKRFSLDAYASFGVDLRNGTLRDRYLAGFTWVL